MAKFCANGHQMEDSWAVCPYCQRTGFQGAGQSAGVNTRMEGDAPKEAPPAAAASAGRKTVLLTDKRKPPVVGWFVALTGDQKSAIDGVLRENRQRLFDLSTAVQREDFAMQGLMDADQPDEGKILAQVDKLAAARAELEKANARMLLAMRRVLTADQWRKLQEFNRAHPPQRRPPPGE